MKLWALILAAGTIIAFAAPAADAASPSAGSGGSARTANSIQPDGPHTTMTFRDPLRGNDRFVRPLGRPTSAAPVGFVASDKLEAVLNPRPHFWPALSPRAWLFWALLDA